MIRNARGRGNEFVYMENSMFIPFFSIEEGYRNFFDKYANFMELYLSITTQRTKILWGNTGFSTSVSPICDFNTSDSQSFVTVKNIWQICLFVCFFLNEIYMLCSEIIKLALYKNISALWPRELARPDLRFWTIEHPAPHVAMFCIGGPGTYSHEN